MKKLFLLLATVTAIFTACEGGLDNEENGGAPFIPEITISPKDLNFSCNGGEQKVDITANFEYEVAERSSWITIEQTDEGLLVIVDANINTSERSAYISISNSQYDINKNIEIYQEAWVPKIELAEQSVEVEFEPAEYEVTVTSPYSWEATSKNDWIVVDTEDGIAGTETLKFSVLRNEEEQERKGTITLKNTDYNLVAELYVTQKAFVPEITIEPESLTFATEGGEQEVAVTANFEYEFSTEADWITIEKSENGLKVTVPNYVEVENRTADITISNEKYGISKVVTVTQGAFVPEITIEPESLIFEYKGGSQEVAVTANFEYEFSTEADWITIEKSKNGVNITATLNAELEERTAEVAILSEKYGISKVVTVTQGAFDPEITVGVESLTFEHKGGLQEVAITANFEYEFSTNADWLTIEESENGIKVTAPNYVEVENRTADITISNEKYGISKTILVIQNGVSVESKQILYTSSNNKIITPYRSDAFGANIVSNTYENGQGVILFDAPVTSIGDWAFCECTSLTSITIPDSVTSIGDWAFSYCTSLTSITIPDSVTSIGDWAFSYCTSLTSVTIGNSVTEIGRAAFSDCTSLTSITIPDSVTSIGEGAFQRCTSLKAFYGKFASADNRCLIVNGVLNSFAPAGLTEYTIPDSVTSIGSWAFHDCDSLTNITIPDSVTSIGEGAFYDCTSLTSITIPDSVTSIGEQAFPNCKGLTSVTIGNSVTSIGDFAFCECTSLTSITIPDSVTSIGRWAFNGCTGELIINSKLVETDYTNINYPMHSSYGWLYGSKFTKLTIGDNITKIGDYAFYSCDSLTSITIPDSVTSIGDRAFYECDSLTSITIPDSVTLIGDWAFGWCTSLTSVYCKATTPPTGGSDMFSYVSYSGYIKPIGCTIYVPRNSLSAYKSAENWSDYASYIKGYNF